MDVHFRKPPVRVSAYVVSPIPPRKVKISSNQTFLFNRVMMALEEIPYEEIAETIGITQNNVRVRMNRIREKLRKLMTA